ncbi:hypothetical protein [Brevibacillus choshinensis]|uniref:Glycosyl transferase n=1 Tax=Brevibacillus choshinensis TaxID=54911 RepID=A0ABX7FU81_BRECH|nr:hypothetical protein [Brevibacillus choshinensis]QRG69330.1 hypothetical protein JNE38_09475 [Brevibacillus choshinensis]
MSLPIVFIHRGDDDYLAYALAQARSSNPHSPIFLLGKPINQPFAQNGVIHVMMDDYMEPAANFAKVYKHIHYMPYEYNLFCFQRWFVLRDFMRKHNLPKCCYLDSDVMLYTDVNQPHFESFSMEFVWTNFIELQRLERFCAYVTAHFEDLGLFGQVVSFAHKSKDHVRFGMPLITDMVLSVMYLRQFRGYRWTHGLYHDGFFDGNIQQPFMTESHDGNKKVYLKDGALYCKDRQSSRDLKLYTLHFQGDIMKNYMKFFYSPSFAQSGVFYFDYQRAKWVPVN